MIVLDINVVWELTEDIVDDIALVSIQPCVRYGGWLCHLGRIERNGQARSCSCSAA